jgi:uncharacterized membrane protein
MACKLSQLWASPSKQRAKCIKVPQQFIHSKFIKTKYPLHIRPVQCTLTIALVRSAASLVYSQNNDEPIQGCLEFWKSGDTEMLNKNAAWFRFCSYFITFCFLYTSIIPVLGSSPDGSWRINAGSLSQAHADSGSLFPAPVTEYANHAAHEKVLTLSRQLSRIKAADLVDGALTLTYRVHNNRPDPLQSLVLTTVLDPSVQVLASSEAVAAGEGSHRLSWVIEDLGPYQNKEITLDLVLSDTSIINVDLGATVHADYKARKTSTSSYPAFLIQDDIAAEYLSCTIDADCNDPVVVNKAAELGNDPQAIFGFVRDQIAYEVYEGSLRGARGTLWSKAGNSVDQTSLLIALLRASGIASRYVQGTIEVSQAQQLIAGMYNPNRASVGAYPDGVEEYADPLNDAKSISQARVHHWAEVYLNGSFVAADPSFQELQLGDEATSRQLDFAEVADAQRHQFNVQVQAERLNTLLGGGKPSRTTVLNHVFKTVELVGKPVSLSHLISSTGASGFFFFNRVHTYTPYLVINDGEGDPANDRTVSGSAYQEVYSNFAGFNEILTGVFVNMRSLSPSGEVVEYQRPIFDRGSYATRKAGGSFDFPEDLGERRAFEPTDIYTMLAGGSLIDENAMIPFAESLRGMEDGVRSALENYETTESDADLVDLESRMRPASRMKTSIATLMHAAASDRFLVDLRRSLGTSAYWDSSRILVSHAESNERGYGFSIDLRHNSPRVSAGPGEPARMSAVFNTLRGFLEGSLEARVLAELSGTTEVANATDIFEKAFEEGADFEALVAGDEFKVDNFAITANARIRILEALAEGKIVVTPTRNVLINDVATVSWYEIDPVVGTVIAMGENGGHSALVGYATMAGDNGLKKVAWLIIGAGHGMVEGTFTFLTTFFEKVHTKPINDVLKDAKFAMLDKAIMKVLNFAVDKKVKEDTAKQAIKLAQCFIKIKPVSGSVGVEDNGSKFVLCIAQLATKVNILDPLWKKINKVGKDWYTWGAVAGILGTAAWFDYSLGIDPELPPFRISDFSQPEWFDSTEASIDASLTGGAFELSAHDEKVSGWIEGADRHSYFTSDEIVRARNGDLLSGPFSLGLNGEQVLVRADQIGLSGHPIPQAVTLTAASGSAELQGTSTYNWSAQGSAAQRMHPAQDQYEYSIALGQTLEVDLKLATSLSGNYRLDVEAPLGWDAQLDGNQLSVKARPGTAAGVYPLYVTAQALDEPALIVGYQVDVVVAGAVPGVTVQIVSDPLFTVGVGRSQLPSAFRARITNTGSSADQFAVNFTQIPSGFSLISSTSTVAIDSGHTAQIGFHFTPDAGLPAAGTLVDFELEVVSQSDPTIRQTLSHSFNVPQVHEVSMTHLPAQLAGAPGDTVSTTMTLSALGNVDEQFALAVSAPAGLAVSGVPASVVLSGGHTVTYPVEVTVDTGIAINQDFRIEVVADLCNGVDASLCTVSFPTARESILALSVRSEAVAGLLNAGTSANDSGFLPMADELERLADALVELEQNPSGAGVCASVARSAANLRTLVSTEPSLNVHADAFATLETTALGCDPTQIVIESGNLATTLVTGMTEYRDYRFSAGLFGSKQVLLPGSSVEATVAVHNEGDKSITVRLAASKPSALDLNFADNDFVLLPGTSASVPVTLSSTVEGEFSYDIDVSTLESSQTRTYAGSVVSLLEPFHVMLVDTTPRIINPGDSFQVLSRIVNSANVTAAVEAVTVITPAHDPDPVFESSPSIGLTIPGGNRLDPYTLDLVDTTGWSEGDYRVTVSLQDPGSGAVVGSGAATLYVGAPVRAYANVSPEFVPPGSAQTRTQIELQRFISGSGTNLGFTPTPLDRDRINWAAASNGAVITGPSWDNLYLLNDGLGSDTTPYVNTTYANASANPLQIDLGQSRRIDEVEFMLWDGDARYYRYRLEASEDGVNYVTLADKSSGEARGRQRITFPETDIRYLRLYGLYNSANGGFHLIEEFRVIGDAVGTPVPAQSITLEGGADSGSTYASGQAIELNAGIYEVRYESGALSLWGDDGANSGRTWDIDYQVEIPGADKFYRPHFVHNALTRYADVAGAEADNFGASFLIYMPTHGTAHFWHSDSSPSDNRGALTLSLRQVSGAANSLLPQVRDAMTRSATWQQRELAAWDNWGNNGGGACYGCHIQAQGMAGLSESVAKLPDLPVHESVFTLADSSFRSWQNQAGWVSPRHGGSYRTTQTSLWAWSVSYFDEPSYLGLAGPIANSFDYLFTRQGATGWNHDHSSPAIYSDGQPSATHTAGNIQALSRYLGSNARFERLDSPQADHPEEIYFAQSEPNVIDVELGALSGVTGIALEINDTFASNKNFVINEVQFFNGAQQVVVAATEASFAQSGFPIAETVNGVLSGNGDGWAHSPRNVTTQPAVGLWTFAVPENVDRVRLHQRYDSSNHKIRRFTVRATTDANPTLATANFADIVPANVHNGLDDSLIETHLLRAADTFLAETWPYSRNLRTAAQTLIGLDASLPHFDESTRLLAAGKINEIEQYLRDLQFEGGWKKTDRVAYGPQPYQTAQALEALLTSTSSSVDPAILAATDYLLNSQSRDGSWTSIDLDKKLAATTWVEIALPTLFDLLSSITFRVEHTLPSSDVAVVPNSAWPLTSNDSSAQQLVWEVLMDQTTQMLRVDLALSNLQAGDVIPVSTGTVVEYASVEGSGSFTLPPLMVAVKHVLAIEPDRSNAAPGSSVTYQITLENLLEQTDSFEFDLSGLPEGWAADLAPISLAAGERRTFALTVNVPLSAELSEYNFRVAAVSNLGVEDSAGAQLTVYGQAEPITLDADGVLVDVIPDLRSAGRGTVASYVARVYNIGDNSDRFALSADLPNGLVATFSQTEVAVEPGSSHYVDVPFTVQAGAGASAGDLNLVVNAASTRQGVDVDANADATLRILPLGVAVDITPESGLPDDTYVVTVTNLGETTDSFELSLGGIAALGASPLPTSVSLAAGASQSFPVQLTNLDVFATPQAVLKASAASQSDSQVFAEDAASIAIAASHRFAVSINPGAVDLEQPDSVRFSLNLDNTGNVEDGYDIAISSVSGPLTCALEGLYGEPTQRIPEARLPALSSGLIHVDCSLLEYGQGTVTVVVTSHADAQLSQAVVATINSEHPNQAPIANAGEDRAQRWGTPVTLDGSGSDDPDGLPQPLTYAWTFVSVPDASQLTDLDLLTEGAGASFVPDLRGAYEVRLAVFDGALSDTDQVLISISNNPPVALAGDDRNVATGSPVSLDGSGSFDPEGDLITFSWENIGKPTNSGVDSNALSDRSLPNPVFTPDMDGIFTFRLVVNDGVADSTPDAVSITAETANVPPNAMTAADFSSNLGQAVALDGSASVDPDHGPEPLSHVWSLVSKPGDSTLTDADIQDRDQPMATITPDVVGAYTFVLTVFDGLATGQASLTVSVEQFNVLPNANAGSDQAQVLGQAVALDGSGSNDPDHGPDALAYHWHFVSVPEGSALTDQDFADPDVDGNSAFVPDLAGSYVIELGIFDGAGWDFDNVLIVVTPPNQPPEAAAGADQTRVLGESVGLDGSASSDPDQGPQALTYQWRFLAVASGSAITDQNLSGADQAVSGFTPDVAGSYTVELGVYDGAAWDYDTVLVIVDAPAPEALLCDVDSNGYVDRTDINLIYAKRNTPAQGADDPYDWNGDGMIDVLDSRGCTLECTLPRCATP